MKILHRAKEAKTRNWVYGLYAGSDDFIVINEEVPRTAKIHPETLCVYTGKDCADTKKPIFTNQIVKDYNDDLYVVFYDSYTCSFRLRSSLIYSSSKEINGNLRIVGNIFDNEFIEPEQRAREATSRTPTSESFNKRNLKESLRGIGL